ncbi:MAG: hypothetical protein L3I99_03660 [Sulfurimonas sp.]|nr:hypothetical protein [Sulfurimonas sp.]
MKYIKFILIIFVSLIFISCNNSKTSTDTNINANEGAFIDSPVKGLRYTTDKLSGYTDDQGKFLYMTGETVSFFLGDLKLGEAIGQKIITPLTLNKEYNLNNIGIKATNIARILQTLDNDPLNGAKLVINSELRNLKISGLDLKSEADINTIITKAQDLTNVNYILVNSTMAQNEMKNYLEKHYINLTRCVSCHGQNFEKKALQQSLVVKDMTKEAVTKALLGYKYGPQSIMKSQISFYTDEALKNSGLGTD